MSYTEERLKINEKWIQSESGHGVAYFGLPDMDEANARRLVVCWNACDGIATDSLERGSSGHHQPMLNLAKRNQSLLDERDELVKALRDLYMHGFSINMSDRVNAILARYQEGKS